MELPDVRDAPAVFRFAIVFYVWHVLHAIRPYFDIFIIYYLSNIPICFKTLEEYEEYVRKVLDALYQQNLSVNIEKSEFYIRETVFFRYLLSENEVRIELSKVEAIRN